MSVGDQLRQEASAVSFTSGTSRSRTPNGRVTALHASASTKLEPRGPGVRGSPEELFAAAVANSLASTILKLAQAASLPIESVEAEVRALLEPDDLARHRVARARILVRARTSADPVAVFKLIVDARERSPICRAIATTVPLLLEVSLLPASRKRRVRTRRADAAPRSDAPGRSS